MKNFNSIFRFILLLAWPFVSATGGLAQDDALPFDKWDADSDGNLTPEELFGRQAGAEDSPPLLEWHRQVLEQADQNADGLLSREEFTAGEDVEIVGETERWYVRTGWPKFTEQDADGDGIISRDELLADVPDESRRERERDVRLIDFDDSGDISFEEFLCWPGVASATRRGRIPDPVFERMDEVHSGLITDLTELDADSDGVWSEEEWPQDRMPEHFVSPTAAASFTDWDRDNDGHIDPGELRFRLEVLFGIRHSSGVRLRRANGQVMHWRAVAGRDRNGDLVLTLGEAHEFNGNAGEWFKQMQENVDTNVDGEVSLEELGNGGRFFTDLLSYFQRLDSDADGGVSPEELAENVETWNRVWVSQAFPGFDADGDGSLSFRELRQSPSGNLYRVWRPRDADGDGWISLLEYHGSSDPFHLELSGMLFSILDRDQDARLSLREVDFDIDPTGLPPERLVAALDRDADERLSTDELFGLQASDGAGMPPLERHRRSFLDADSDSDGSIDEEESVDSASLLNAVTDFRWLSANAWPKFQEADANHDAVVTLEELLATVREEIAEERKRDFRLVDFDGSEALSLEEYLCVPGSAPADHRGSVPDPIAMLMEDRLARLITVLEEAGTASDGTWSRDTWPERLPDSDDVSGISAPFDAWDNDGNGQVTETELRFRLEVLYGIRHESGVRLRRETGMVLDWRAFQDRDEDHDLRLTVEEVAAVEPERGTESFQRELARLDSDGDGRMSLEELGHGSKKYWRDTLGDFCKLDADLDGLVDPHELMENVRRWERDTAGQVFPAFDEDGDGRLSFREFRTCPLANPCRNWLPRDEDSDGQISLAEYHGGSGLMHVELSRTLFGRLDRNDDDTLSLDEISFKVDLKTAPLPLVFQVRDENADGLLTLDEISGAPPAGDLDSEARQNYERKLMRIEDGLRMADEDGDRMLSLAEFTSNEEAAAEMFPGRARSRRRSSPTNPVAAQVEVAAQEWNLRLIGLVALNIVALAGLCWFVFKPSASR